MLSRGKVPLSAMETSFLAAFTSSSHKVIKVMPLSGILVPSMKTAEGLSAFCLSPPNTFLFAFLSFIPNNVVSGRT